MLWLTVRLANRFTVVLLTRGNPAIFPPDLIAKTREEFKQVHNMLGVQEQIVFDFLAPGLEEVPDYESLINCGR